ncbi:MAG: VWA domain-containing protein [Atopobiaceae bacterium]|nr:VWA domain-containing protein [Atopobiaceae bacterium]
MRTTTSIETRPHNVIRLALGACALICSLLPFLAISAVAHADEVTALPSVLVVDSNTGDGAQCAYYWLGGENELVAESDDMGLYTSAKANWWQTAGGSGDAPATFVLYGTGAQALTAEDVAWALDVIRESGAEPRTLVVAMGMAGLPVRKYAEDMSATKQSSRADLVGLVFCGTPHNGYSASESYPESELWTKLSQAVGLEAKDLAPKSDFLAELNAGEFPAVTKTLALAGSAGDLGFGMTDGAGLTEELVPATTLSSQIENGRVEATIGRAINLTGLWQPFTSSIDYPQRNIDAKPTELLSAMDSYETAADVQVRVGEFYADWFKDGVPVTHNSSVLLLDLSGSMTERIDASNTKLAAAKEAAQEYLRAMDACSALPQAAPMDVSVIGFEETVTGIATSYDQGACDAVANMEAYGETNIGIALDEAIATLASAPACAAKHVLLLSDGASTRGQSEEQILAGAVAQAQGAGIAIDTIGFGNVGESDAGFLKRVADETGGTYYTAQDTYSLKVNFLKAYYSSLGLSLVDEELQAGTTSSKVLGRVGRRTTALEIGVVSQEGDPQLALTCNGEKVDESLYTVSQESGLTSLQYLEPTPGEYELQLSGAKGAAHVFAVRQQGIMKEKAVAGEQRDISLYLLAAAGAALALGLVGVVFFTQRRSVARSSAAARASVRPTPAPHNEPAIDETVISWDVDDKETRNGSNQ